jgi:hypothetical protein
MKNTVLHSTRGHADHGWLNAYSFSFAAGTTQRVQFGAPFAKRRRRNGFCTHPHDNMENHNSFEVI